MILRKPYAILIKNFKKIHFILFILISFLFFYSNKIVSFFNQYDKKSQIVFDNDLVSYYIKPIMFILIFFVIAFGLSIFILMRQKKKPIKLYISMIAYYIILIVFLYVIATYLNTIQFEGLAPRSVRILRDLNFLSITFQIIFGVLILIRSVGFDIKKFNFGEDIIDLNIDVNDNEEFELTSGVDVDEISKTYRKQKRELKYFYAENKPVIIGIISFAVISIVSLVLFNIQVVNKVYKIGDNININGLYIEVNNFYSTKLDYKGLDVSEKGYTFGILSLTLTNKDNVDKKINMENLKIIAGNTIYSNSITKYIYFIDLGNGYNNQNIKPDEKKEYIIVFKIKDEDLKSKLIFRYSDSIIYINNKLKSKYIKVEIEPISLDKIDEFNTAELKKEIYYGLSFLHDTTLKITKVDISNKFEYEIGSLKSYVAEPMSNKVILKISYDLKIDSNIKYISNMKDFIDRFGTISYTNDNKKYMLSYTDLTPSKYSLNDIYLSVSNKINTATSLNLNITVRNKQYSYSLK